MYMSYQVLIFDVGTMMHVQWNFQPIVWKQPLLILCVYNSHTSLETPSTGTTSVLHVYFFVSDSAVQIAPVQTAETEAAQWYEHRGGKNG